MQDEDKNIGQDISQKISQNLDILKTVASNCNNKQELNDGLEKLINKYSMNARCSINKNTENQKRY